MFNTEKRINLAEENDAQRDCRFAKWLIKKHGLQVIPTSSFYTDKSKSIGENYVRLSFIKVRLTANTNFILLKKIYFAER